MFHRFTRKGCPAQLLHYKYLFRTTSSPILSSSITSRLNFRSMYSLTKPIEEAKLKVSDIHTLQFVFAKLIITSNLGPLETDIKFYDLAMR